MTREWCWGSRNTPRWIGLRFAGRNPAARSNASPVFRLTTTSPSSKERGSGSSLAEAWSALIREGLALARNANPMVGELVVHLWHIDLLHVAGGAVLCAHGTGCAGLFRR